MSRRYKHRSRRKEWQSELPEWYPIDVMAYDLQRHKSLVPLFLQEQCKAKGFWNTPNVLMQDPTNTMVYILPRGLFEREYIWQ